MGILYVQQKIVNRVVGGSSFDQTLPPEDVILITSLRNLVLPEFMHRSSSVQHLRPLVEKLNDQDRKRNADHLNHLVARRAPTYKHRGGISSLRDSDCEDMHLLTYLLDRRERNKIRLLLEHGMDIQHGIDWTVCQEMIGETAIRSRNREYDSLVAMIEDASDFFPKEEQYIKVGVNREGMMRAFNYYAAYVQNWAIVIPFLQRHGSLYHLHCWSDNETSPYLGTTTSWLTRYMKDDLISFRLRWNLFISSFSSPEFNIGWLTIPCLHYGISEEDDFAHLYGSCTHSLRERLICPFAIVVASHYENYDTAGVLLKLFCDSVIPQSHNTKLIAIAPLLLQTLVDFLLSHCTEAPLTYVKLLVEKYHANPNRLYSDKSAPREIMRNLYLDLIEDSNRDVPFTSKEEEEQFITMTLKKLTPKEGGGSSILHHLSGQYVKAIFAYLIEKGGGNPWLSQGGSPDSTPFHEALRSHGQKGVLDYYFDKGLIKSINDCCLDNNTMTPLMYACWIGSCPIIDSLFHRKPLPDVNTRNRYGETAIIFAAQRNHYAVILKLFKFYGRDQIDLDVHDREGNSLQQIVFRNDLYRLKLKEWFPESWNDDKNVWGEGNKSRKKAKK